MVQHHQARNQEDPDWCLKEVWRQADDASAVVLLTDLRTRADIQWFARKCGGRDGLVLLRVEAGGEARRLRGWQPDRVKDELYSETDLDTFDDWDACFDNSADVSAGLAQEWA